MTKFAHGRGAVVAGLSAMLVMAVPALAGPDDLPPFEKVSEGFEKVISTADGKPSLYTVFVNEKTNDLLAELPRGYKSQKHFFAVTPAAGSAFAGLQGPSRYVYWKKYGKRLALIQPEIDTRSEGEQESKSSVARLFTDRVLLDVAIVAKGPGGQPVIDLDDLLLKHGDSFGGRGLSRSNTRLTRVVSAKAFPENIEIALEVPDSSGRLVTVHYSISSIPDRTGYKPREADERVGYFTTVYRDLGQYDNEKKWVRYIDRWHLEKRDPKLSLSPPKEPVVFYLEHTVPVRYRRWVRNGVLYWNEAFRQVGLDEAIQVRIQDKTTGAHMDKDPEDVRYNFIRWLNNDVSTAIGPHRAHPLTGQILDADVVLTDGWIRAYWRWHQQLPELAIQSFSPETLLWLEDHPDWDPRLLLATEVERERILERRAGRTAEERLAEAANPIVHQHGELAEIGRWLGCDHHMCLAAHGLAFEMATARLHFEALDLVAPASAVGMDDVLDGIPEWFVGPLLAELTAHEVGHTLGLRHNFKASSVYSLDEINSEAMKGAKPLAGSVMDYLPANINIDEDAVQGDYTMIGVGPYDMWAIEYGYTFGDTAEVLRRVSEPELAYLTDDDTGGCDPLARRYDFSADPLQYAMEQGKLVQYHRERVLDKYVKEGQSWSKAREGYNMTLGLQTRALSMAANWIGGAHVNRDRKGDPGERPPLEVVDPGKQRQALAFVIEHAFHDDAFGLTPELLVHMTVDKWSDRSPGDRGESAWPVHESIQRLQETTLTMVLNPTTLRRVFDNELRTPADDDALTVPELMDAVAGAVYTELDTDLDGATFTNRTPMISSLRRNLQSSTADRLIYLSKGDRFMPRGVRTVCLQHLRTLDERLEKLLDKKAGGQLDDYTVAHLDDLHTRVRKALDAVYVTGM